MALTTAFLLWANLTPAELLLWSGDGGETPVVSAVRAVYTAASELVTLTASGNASVSRNESGAVVISGTNTGRPVYGSGTITF